MDLRILSLLLTLGVGHDHNCILILIIPETQIRYAKQRLERFPQFHLGRKQRIVLNAAQLLDQFVDAQRQRRGMLFLNDQRNEKISLRGLKVERTSPWRSDRPDCDELNSTQGQKLR
jgi:hypothetical protein